MQATTCKRKSLDTVAEIETARKEILSKYAKSQKEVMNTPASAKQVGGDWYKTMSIEPAYFAEMNHLSALEHLAIKYICRHRKKDGALDLDKAIHALELLKEYTYSDLHQDENLRPPS